MVASGTGVVFGFFCLLKTTSVTPYSSADASYLKILVLLMELYCYDLCCET